MEEVLKKNPNLNGVPNKDISELSTGRDFRPKPEFDLRPYKQA